MKDVLKVFAFNIVLEIGCYVNMLVNTCEPNNCFTSQHMIDIFGVYRADTTWNA